MAVKKSKPAEVEAAKAPETKAVTRGRKQAGAVGAKEAPAPPPQAKEAPAPKAKGASPGVASATASKAETPKPSAAPRAPAAAPKKSAAPVKLTDRQLDFLKQIQGSQGPGYLLQKKVEQKTIEALLDRKLIKRGAKDKASGHFRYMVSRAGEKHLSTISPA